MRDASRIDGVTRSARTVGSGAASHVIAAQQRPPHMFPQR